MDLTNNKTTKAMLQSIVEFVNQIDLRKVTFEIHWKSQLLETNYIIIDIYSTKALLSTYGTQ